MCGIYSISSHLAIIYSSESCAVCNTEYFLLTVTSTGLTYLQMQCSGATSTVQPTKTNITTNVNVARDIRDCRDPYHVGMTLTHSLPPTYKIVQKSQTQKLCALQTHTCSLLVFMYPLTPYMYM